MQTQRKAKRKLSNISFQHEGAHVALVSKDQGGPANGHDYALVMKANNFSKEFIEKAQRIKVEMELPEFLKRFYNMWYEDEAKELAKLFGWVDYEEMLDGVESALEGERSVEIVEVSPADYVRTKLQDVEQMTALAEAESLAATLASLTEAQYLTLLQDQEAVEKALKSKESNAVAPVAVAGDTSIAGEVKEEVSTSVTKNKDVNMTKQVEVNVEVVEKAQFESVQKALEEQTVALNKALETIAAFEQEKKAAIEKQRLADVKAAVKDESHAEVLFKAVKDATDEDFVAVVKALAAISIATEQSELFIEKGATVEEQAPVKTNPVEQILKSKYQSK